MIIGYARVSTDGQTLNAKPDALTSAGAGKVLLKVWTKGQPKPHVGGTARTPVAEVGHQRVQPARNIPHALLARVGTSTYIEPVSCDFEPSL
jgi:hypothetical protein